MKAHLLLAFILAVAVGACGEATETADAPTDTEAMEATSGPQPCTSLVGSWELVSIAEDAPALAGEFESDPDYQQAPTLKILNETHWMFIRQSSEQFIHAQGGPYNLENGTYTEHVEYSAVPANIGKDFEFICEMEGDSLWHHRGGQGDYRYDELWRRVR